MPEQHLDCVCTCSLIITVNVLGWEAIEGLCPDTALATPDGWMCHFQRVWDLGSIIRNTHTELAIKKDCSRRGLHHIKLGQPGPSVGLLIMHTEIGTACFYVLLS